MPYSYWVEVPAPVRAPVALLAYLWPAAPGRC